MSTGWSALTEAVKIFGPAATTQEFLKKLLKWQVDVGGGSMKCSMFKRKVVEAEILLVFFRVVKGDAEFKIFHSMLKYNDFLLLKISRAM